MVKVKRRGGGGGDLGRGIDGERWGEGGGGDGFVEGIEIPPFFFF